VTGEILIPRETNLPRGCCSCSPSQAKPETHGAKPSEYTLTVILYRPLCAPCTSVTNEDDTRESQIKESRLKGLGRRRFIGILTSKGLPVKSPVNRFNFPLYLEQKKFRSGWSPIILKQRPRMYSSKLSRPFPSKSIISNISSKAALKDEKGRTISKYFSLLSHNIVSN